MILFLNLFVSFIRLCDTFEPLLLPLWSCFVTKPYFEFYCKLFLLLTAKEFQIFHFEDQWIDIMNEIRKQLLITPWKRRRRQWSSRLRSFHLRKCKVVWTAVCRRWRYRNQRLRQKASGNWDHFCFLSTRPARKGLEKKPRLPRGICTHRALRRGAFDHKVISLWRRRSRRRWHVFNQGLPAVKRFPP